MARANQIAGPIEQALSGQPASERLRIKSEALRDAFANLPAGQRASFALNGVTIQFIDPPALLRNASNQVVGLRVRVRAQDAQGKPLPESDGVHQVINPPVKVPDGTTRTDVHPLTGLTVEAPNFTENPVAALRQWLYESVTAEARRLGWNG